MTTQVKIIKTERFIGVSMSVNRYVLLMKYNSMH
jgi:hypothetical protein